MWCLRCCCCVCVLSQHWEVTWQTASASFITCPREMPVIRNVSTRSDKSSSIVKQKMSFSAVIENLVEEEFSSFDYVKVSIQQNKICLYKTCNQDQLLNVHFYIVFMFMLSKLLCCLKCFIHFFSPVLFLKCCVLCYFLKSFLMFSF